MLRPIGLDDNGEKIFFGQLDTADLNVLNALPGETTETLDAFIQGRPEFQKRVPGEIGIWFESERLGKIVVGHQKDGAIAKMKALGQKMLRAMLAAAGQSFPVTASTDELALAAAELDESKFQPKPLEKVAAVGVAEDRGPETEDRKKRRE